MLRRSWTGSLLLALSLAVMAPFSASASPPAASAGTSAEARIERRADAAASVPLENITTTTTQVASGLKRPTAIVAPDDGTGRLFITEKPGTVRVYHPDTGLAETPLVDITSEVDNSGNERGLLGIALPPDFADSQELYLAYTALPDGAVTLARHRLDGDGPEVLLAQEHAEYSNHNGGQLAFGPDGYLYWSIGDGGGSGDPFRSGQRLDTLLGKIMRIDVGGSCGDLPYCIPEDNPFVGVEGAREEIWLYGLRNPWRFSIDPADGSMWIGDVGQGRWEEINHLTPEQGGANLGWSCYEGLEVFDEEHCLPGEEYTEPVFTYPLSGGGCAVIGGHVYRGEEYADLMAGTYVATDYCSSTVWALRPDGEGGYEQAEIGKTPTQVTAIGTTAEGEFYVVNDLPGGLHRVSFEDSEPVRTCHVDYTMRTWGTGFTADVTVTNTGATPIEGWALSFALPAGQDIISGWNAVFSEAAVVTVGNAEYNATIPPGASVDFGFVASHTGDTSPPRRFELNGGECATGTAGD
ncbi:glucose/sorbosone dehydrogenase-like protein [Streptomyces sp. TRM43335]|uniref:Glucose/sorbosone dehydrogenase-like protein n=1 Tax=Streptomyces taklimakanensis TaxID=2569853 RepID=A0A6G2B9X1_9ACTN|nr:PQQ-dependent sugar dehydrogenase [Streptomyces taklimakanensis]MTE18863.1 glucose/sorbosone dehydrogenase-like protein [Streptomyces taklimakanensis]